MNFKKIVFTSTCFVMLIGSFVVLDSNAAEIEQPNKNISRYPVPKFEDLPKETQEIMLHAKEKYGFVPNVQFAFAHRPEQLKAFLEYGQTIMRKNSGITKAEKEMIIVATSNANGCMYCVVSHSAALRKLTGDPYISEPVAVNYREADISPRQKAMLDFAMKVTQEPWEINEHDFKRLRKHGINKEDAWDIASITAFFNMSNRMMNLMATRPDEEFYSIGR